MYTEAYMTFTYQTSKIHLHLAFIIDADDSLDFYQTLFCTIVLTKSKSKQDNILPQKMFLLFWSENSTHKQYGATFEMKT